MTDEIDYRKMHGEAVVMYQDAEREVERLRAQLTEVQMSHRKEAESCKVWYRRTCQERKLSIQRKVEIDELRNRVDELEAIQRRGMDR